MRQDLIHGHNCCPFFLIFTDLDGTLLDHVSYEWDKARPALDLCRELHIPVIMVSSKTRAEMETIRKELELSSPFISENGGGIFFPKELSDRLPSGTVFAEDIWRLEVGTPYGHLVRKLQEIREELGCHIKGFSEMTAGEISHLTGLDPESSRLAAEREYDEPFIVQEQEGVDIDILHDAAERRGLTITEGGRFLHLHGKNDKGAAVKRVTSWYRELHHRLFSIAIGDSPNDFSMFKQVDQPVLVRSNQAFPGIEREIPGLKITREPGPEGWNSAVLEILDEKNMGGNS
ncbi:MAG: HAD-IIB family hydrolase [Deltaproteobacteria bacterium]|nr:HAD-IIB family hydrolase [Deltaproteobacteria bacterium]